MSSRPRKSKKTEKQTNEIIDIDEFAKDMKPGEVRMIGDIYVFSVFPCDPPEPINRPSKGKPKRK